MASGTAENPVRQSGFDEATAVRPDGAPGRYTADVDPRWSIGGRINGGYLLATATRAALAESGAGHDHPLAVTGAFVAPATPGPATITVQALRRGRATSLLSVRVHSGEPAAVCLEAIVTTGRLGRDEPLVAGPRPPALPPEQVCPLLPSASEAMQVPLLDQVHERFDPACLGFTQGRPSGTGELRAWVRFADGRDPDPLGLVCLGDALPPPSFELPGLESGWVPTLQLSTFVRAVPAPGPLVARTHARSVGAGALDETCDLWDSTGRLVAVTHQLAVVRPA